MTNDECEKDNYEKICMQRFDKIDRTLEYISKRLFLGNGDAPIDVQIDRNTQFRTEHDKQTQTQGNRVWTAIIGIAIAVIGKLAYDLLSR